MKLLILGANGMIGSAMMRAFLESSDYEVFGLIRDSNLAKNHAFKSVARIITKLDLNNSDHLSELFCIAAPDVVINCAGLTKHLPGGNLPLSALALNSILPHRLEKLCEATKSRLIHISTDCVFSGEVGMYQESDFPDARDIYGKSKCLGEVTGQNSVTLRTSTIGHEIGTKNGLLEWFLSQSNCSGYQKAIFSGLTTVEFAKVVRDHVIPNKNISGLYHVGATPIDKFSLLKLIASVYSKKIQIIPDDSFKIDRSLNINKFQKLTGYCPPSWDNLVSEMYSKSLY